MSRLGSNLVVVLLALMFAGAGWHLVAKRRLEAEIAAAEARKKVELVQLRTENRELKERLNTRSENVEASLPSAPAANPLARARLGSELMRSGLMGRMTWPDPDRNSLAAGISDLAGFLALTPNETAALQQAAKVGEQAFAAALVSHASVKRDGTWVAISVKEEPEVRAAYDRMLELFAGILGAERYSLYKSLGAKQAVEKLFNKWGMEPFTLMVSHSTTIPDAFYPPSLDSQGNPRPSSLAGRSRGSSTGRLLYYYTRMKPDQRGSGGVSGSDTIENVGTNVGPLYTLIPADL